MLVRRKGSKKRKRKFYEAISFSYNTPIEQVIKFLGNLGKVEIREEGELFNAWVVLEDNRRVGPNQYMLKDDRRKRIISFDPTTFYLWYDIWNI